MGLHLGKEWFTFRCHFQVEEQGSVICEIVTEL